MLRGTSYQVKHGSNVPGVSKLPRLSRMCMQVLRRCSKCATFHADVKKFESSSLPLISITILLQNEKSIHALGHPKIHFVKDSGIWPLRGEGVYY